MQTLYNISLKEYNTFKIDVNAQSFFNVTTIDELKSFIIDFDHHESLLVLGGGSNVLFVENFDGFVLRMGIKGLDVIFENEEFVLIKSMAGEEWDDLVKYCVEMGYGGVENLSHIPGSVGAAPIQNIGAYGVEFKDVFVQLEAIEIKSGKIRSFTNEDCVFGYRNSVFKNDLKGQYIILSLTLKLDKFPVLKLNYGELARRFDNSESITLKDIRNAIIEIRDKKLPDTEKYGCAGSFFKNPEVTKEKARELKEEYPDLNVFPAEDGKMKVPAGWLIEECGFKGIRRGDAGIFENHALILINHGKATGQEIYNLASEIMERVANKFGINLEFEVNVIRNQKLENRN